MTVFAEDSTGIIDSKKEINDTINSLINWMNHNNLKINVFWFC